MKKSAQKIVRRTRGRGTDGTVLTSNELRARGFDLDGTNLDRLRWRIRSENISKRTAANDEVVNAWRVAA